jgi:oxygen-independent coproporphyrinogen-3 oxidase
VQNAKTLHEYYQAIDAGELAIVRGFESNDSDEIVGQVIQDLMCKFAVSFDDFHARTGFAFGEYFAEHWPALLQFQKDGLLQIDSDKIVVTGQGRYLIRIICMTFDTYLKHDTEKFSKAI